MAKAQIEVWDAELKLLKEQQKRERERERERGRYQHGSKRPRTA